MSDGSRFEKRGMHEAVFHDCAMPGSRFEDVNLTGATFTDVSLRQAKFRDVNLAGASIEDANIEGLTIFGQDVQALLKQQEDAAEMVAEPQLFVADIEAACEFYMARLGFRLAFLHGTPAFYAQVIRGGWRLNLRKATGPVFDAGFREREKDALAATLTLGDVRALFDEYRQAGVAFHQPLRTEPWSALTFIIRDPYGNLLAFAGPEMIGGVRRPPR